MIKTAIRFKNDMVIVLDEAGEQIPDYQGQYDEVKEKILRDAPAGAVFAHGITNAGQLIEAQREKW